MCQGPHSEIQQLFLSHISPHPQLCCRDYEVVAPEVLYEEREAVGTAGALTRASKDQGTQHPRV